MENRDRPEIQTRRIATTKKKRVLIIDDNFDQLFLCKTILATDDYESITALGGREALALLSEIEKPDLILLDMQMDDMSGPEFLIMLEENCPETFKNVPVVYLTANDSVPVSKAVGFIRKPYDFDKFLSAVHRFIEIGTGPNNYKH